MRECGLIIVHKCPSRALWQKPIFTVHPYRAAKLNIVENLQSTSKSILKIIDTIWKTHDTESIFSWDAFEMCSIDLANFHSMLTGLSDRY